MKTRLLGFFLLLLSGIALAEIPKAPLPTGAAAGSAQVQAIDKGQRIFTCGHSFHAFWITPILTDMAESAGIQGQEIVGVSKIGGSRVIQHWAVPDDKNQAKKALQEGRVDVLTLSPMHQPDDGIDKFAQLGVEHNPNLRITIQEFWIPWDQFVWPYKGDPKAIDPNASTLAYLRGIHEPYFKAMDEYVAALNQKLGRQTLFVVPVGQAVLALREKIIAGEAPGIEKQSDLFTDKLGHPQAPLQALAAYCHFAVIYRRSPVGLPMPAILAKANKHYDEKLNRLLQDLAWDAVTHHPLSGVTQAAAAPIK
jgi:hypothetical protein